MKSVSFVLAVLNSIGGLYLTLTLLRPPLCSLLTFKLNRFVNGKSSWMISMQALREMG